MLVQRHLLFLLETNSHENSAGTLRLKHGQWSEVAKWGNKARHDLSLPDGRTEGCNFVLLSFDLVAWSARQKVESLQVARGEDSEELGQHDTEEICSVQLGASLKWDPHATWPPLQVLYEVWTCMSQLSDATSAFSIHALAFFFHLGRRNKCSLSLHQANESNKCIQMPNTSTFRPEFENEWKRKNCCTCSTRHVESQILQKDDTAGGGICAGRLSK